MKVIIPGSFDPITYGHMQIIEETAMLFDTVIVAILGNPDKNIGMFSLDERYMMIKELYLNNPKIEVITEAGATVDIAEKYGCVAIIRGIRGINDLEYEQNLARINQEISNNKIKTIFLLANPNYQHISSTMVKQINCLGKPIDNYVHPLVKKKILLKRKD